jgi:asparagine synthase (glutamine-hydrolysing)
MYLLQSYKNQGLKWFCLEKDEIFGGYLYFANAPSVDFQKETIESPKLFTADLLRADKAMMAHGVETRVPFLDKEFFRYCYTIKRRKNA